MNGAELTGKKTYDEHFITCQLGRMSKTADGGFRIVLEFGLEGLDTFKALAGVPVHSNISVNLSWE